MGLTFSAGGQPQSLQGALVPDAVTLSAISGVVSVLGAGIGIDNITRWNIVPIGVVTIQGMPVAQMGTIRILTMAAGTGSFIIAHNTGLVTSFFNSNTLADSIFISPAVPYIFIYTGTRWASIANL